MDSSPRSTVFPNRLVLVTGSLLFMFPGLQLALSTGQWLRSCALYHVFRAAIRYLRCSLLCGHDVHMVLSS